MACNPPFCEGTGGCGDCNCKCCPPNPCYTSWTYKYYCGTTDTDWDTNIAPSNAGCVCPSPALPFVAPSLGVEFPDFDYEEFKKGFTFNIEDIEKEESAEVYALLLAGCSIPCATITIQITTSGCCLYKTGSSDTSFKAVGAGTITATITGGSSGTHGHSCDGDFQVTINGTPDSKAVTDCETVTIAITPPSPITCCSCCKFESSGTPLSGSGPWSLRRQSTGDGRSKLLLNPAALRNALIQKMLKKR